MAYKAPFDIVAACTDTKNYPKFTIQFWLRNAPWAIPSKPWDYNAWKVNTADPKFIVPTDPGTFYLYDLSKGTFCAYTKLLNTKDFPAGTTLYGMLVTAFCFGKKWIVGYFENKFPFPYLMPASQPFQFGLWCPVVNPSMLIGKEPAQGEFLGQTRPDSEIYQDLGIDLQIQHQLEGPHLALLEAAVGTRPPDRRQAAALAVKGLDPKDYTRFSAAVALA